MKKYENFSKSLVNLQSCRELTQPYSIAEQTGIIGLFEICFEQSWKLMKEILEYHGHNTQKTGSPRLIIKSAYQCGMITDENGCAGGFAAAPQSGVFQNCNGNFEIAHSI